MIDIIPLEVTSLKVIQPELAASLERASGHFESFVADRLAPEQLSESHHCIGDIVGILKMLQIPGALQLAEEMLKMLQKMVAQPVAASDFCLSALSRAFVWMPCYIEYAAERGQVVPSLALPFINELRAALREPLILESELAEFQYVNPIELSFDGLEKAPNLAALVPRQRLMYQVGLIGLLREQNLSLKMRLMHRSAARLAASVGDAPVRTQWRLTEAVLEGLLSGDLQLDYTRKRVLSLIERELRAFSKDCNNGAITASPELLNELVYLVNLSASNRQASSEVFGRLGLERLSVTDRVFQEEKAVMQGPNAETILTMVKALREELAQGKDILESTSPDASGTADIASLTSLFRRTSGILSVIGLQIPADTLTNIRNNIEIWAGHAKYTRDNLLEVADGLVYVETTLANLSRLGLNFDAGDDEQTRLALMAKSQLDEAEAVVIREALERLAASKKDIDSFVESNYDMVHLESVVDTLVSVRGGVQVVKLYRAAAVLLSFERFVRSVIDQGVEKGNVQNVLETIADALIALEYYLSETELHGVAPPNILDIAEQSLSAENS